MQQPRALATGDTVYLELQVRDEVCFLHADMLRLGITLNPGTDCSDFRLDCAFAIYPGNKFAAQTEAQARSKSRRHKAGGHSSEERRLARARAREEHGANERRMRDVDAGVFRQPLRYGDLVQLRHLATGRWPGQDTGDSTWVFSKGLPRGTRPRFEFAPRDDRSSKNEPNRVEHDPVPRTRA